MEKFRDFSIDRAGNDVTINYRAGLCTYGEGIYSGEPRALGFNGIGYKVNPDVMLGYNAIPDVENRCNFIVELGGQSLVSHWEYVSHEKTEENGILTVYVNLRHKLRPAEITVCTKMDGSGCFSRWLKIKNCSDRPEPLGRVALISGILESTTNWKKLLQDDEPSPYRIGYFANDEWACEGQFKWNVLPAERFGFCGRHARNRYRHPFCILENKAKGTCYAIQIAYSGGYKFTFDFKGTGANAALAYTCELDGFKPLRVIAPGETITTPEVLVSMVNGDMDDAIQQMHEHIRSAVMMPPHGPGCYLETCCGAELAAKRGFDIVYVDAGWYYPPGKVWSEWTGKWDVDPGRFPKGIQPLVDEAHAAGIKFGLWMEPERLGAEVSEEYGIFDKHRDWIMETLDGKRGTHANGKGGYYNLAEPECVEYIEDQICKVIENNHIDMFRLDFNGAPLSHYTYRMQDGYLESNDLRYYENFYAMYDRIRKKFPNVIFENCASGGGRTDLGCVKYFDHTWVTDNPVSPRCFAITNGMTMCLPPELVDRLVTTMGAPKMASLEFQLFQLMFVRPTSHFPTVTPENPLQIGKFEEFMKLYSEFARPMLKRCKIYHHTPSFEDAEPKGLGILESVSENADRAMLGVFALCDPKEKETTVRFKGIDASKKYRVTAVSAKESFEATGYELKYKGITTYIKGALTAELFLAQEI